MRMVQGGEHFRFALKARQSVDVNRERWRQDLDGHLTFQLRVGRPVHLAHPAFADLRDDFVDAETPAGCQGQTAWIIPGRRTDGVYDSGLDQIHIVDRLHERDQGGNGHLRPFTLFHLAGNFIHRVNS